jgi:hypothetical protein
MSGYEIAASLVGSVLGSGLVTGIFQVYLNHKFSTKLEELKTSLSGELFERQTKFAWLHTERSKALVKLYALLADVDAAFTVMLMPIQTGDAESRTEQRRLLRLAAPSLSFSLFAQRMQCFLMKI